MKNNENETNKRKIIGIYKITSPSGKIYIGQSINVERRLRQYTYPLKHNEQPILYKSFKKYGVENHKFEIIEECLLEQLDEREIYWGNFYNVLNPKKGLNCRLGNGRKLCSEKLKEKFKITNKGKKIKKVIQYDLNGKFIKEWNSVYEAELSFSSKNHSNISACCLRKQKTAWGYIWRFKIKERTYNKKIEGIKHKRIVNQYDLNKNFIKEWPNIRTITNQLGFSPSTIYECVNGKYKTANGYIWKYKT